MFNKNLSLTIVSIIITLILIEVALRVIGIENTSLKGTLPII